MRSVIYRWITEKKVPSDGCLTHNACAEVWSLCMIGLVERGHLNNRVFGTWESLNWIPVHDLCVKCTLTGKSAYEEGRSTIWEKLPSYLGLPEWSELKRCVYFLSCTIGTLNEAR